MLLVLTAMVFVSTLSLLLGIYAFIRGRRAGIENRLRRIVLDPVIREEAMETVLVAAPGGRHRKKRAAKGRRRYTALLEEKLVQGGLPLRAAEFVSLVAGATFLAAVVVFLLGGGFTHLFLVVTGAVVSSCMFVKMRINQRRRLLGAQVSDMILLMANGLKAGHSLIQVLENISREIQPPLSDYLRTFLRDTIMGVPMEEALRKLEQRTGDEDLSLVITAILIQYQVGGNLAEILNNISHTIRERVRLKGEIRTLTAQGRMSAIVVSLVPIAVALFLFVSNPDFLMVLLEEPVGWFMVGAAVSFQLVGVLLIRRIVDIKV